MEQKTIRLNLDLSFVYGPRTFRVPLAALMLLAAVGDLNSESVTLSTYYPAPSGVYTNMITTGNTFLSRDGGAASRVGVGTTAPGAKLSVAGSMSVGTYAGNVPPANALIVGGRIGIGLTNPAQALDVVGNAAVAGNASVTGIVTVGNYMRVSTAGCSAVQRRGAGSGNLCAATQYATFTPGVYVAGLSYQNQGTPFLVAPDGSRRYVVWGTYGSNQTEMPLGPDDAVQYVCCPR